MKLNFFLTFEYVFYVSSKVFHVMCSFCWLLFIGFFSENHLSTCPGWHFFNIQDNFLIFVTKWMMTLPKRKLYQSSHLCLYITHTRNDVFIRHFQICLCLCDHFVVLFILCVSLSHTHSYNFSSAGFFPRK